MTFLKNTPAYVAVYIIFMIPCYVLPWLGSNSSVLNATGAASGMGLNPLFYAHAASLLILCVACFYRGRFVHKKWLIIFPILAAVFDLVPGINLVPLVGTAMHLAAIIVGVIGAADAMSELNRSTHQS